MTPDNVHDDMDDVAETLQTTPITENAEQDTAGSGRVPWRLR